MRWIFIEPTDVWLFRDGHPFAAGEGHIARSIFPPTPFTVQGALRARVVAASGVSWPEFYNQETTEARELATLIGHPPNRHNSGNLGSFSMCGPYIAYKDGDRLIRYFPLPHDIVLDKEGYADLLRPAPMDFAANWPVQNLLPLRTVLEELDDDATNDQWIDEKGLSAYLQTEAVSFTGWCKKRDLVESEHRYGIAINPKTGQVEESMLYQAEFIRPTQNIGLLVSVNEDLPLSEKGMLALGGERHSARFEILHQRPPDLHFGGDTTRLKVVILTPAYFSGGWQPANGDWSRFLQGENLELRSVALKRPVQIGGWDMALGRPRPMTNYVAPGSVYFFEADTPIAVRTETAFTEALSGLPDAGVLGFGQIATGSWSYREE